MTDGLLRRRGVPARRRERRARQRADRRPRAAAPAHPPARAAGRPHGPAPPPRALLRRPRAAARAVEPRGGRAPRYAPIDDLSPLAEPHRPAPARPLALAGGRPLAAARADRARAPRRRLDPGAPTSRRCASSTRLRGARRLGHAGRPTSRRWPGCAPALARRPRHGGRRPQPARRPARARGPAHRRHHGARTSRRWPGCTALRELDLTGTRVRDLAPLAELSELRLLVLVRRPGGRRRGRAAPGHGPGAARLSASDLRRRPDRRLVGARSRPRDDAVAPPRS